MGAAALTWRDWEWDPAVAAGLVAAAVLYHLHPRVRATPRQRAYFWAGWAAAAVAVFSPLHRGASYLLWLHMVQHLVLMLAAAPAFAASLPPPLLGWLTRRPGLGPVLRVLWNPWVATALYNVAVLAWHLPTLYSWAVASEFAHALQHLSFLLFGVVWWSVLLCPAPRHPPVGVRLVMVGVSAVAQFLPGFVLSVADRVLYPPYLSAPRLWGWSPLDDQRWAGVLMWVATNLAYALTALGLGMRWLRSEEPGRP